MKPIIIIPDAILLGKGSVEFDCNCACSIATHSGMHNSEELLTNSFIQTCQPIKIQALDRDFAVALSPTSHVSLTVINSTAQRVLDFFEQGGTLDDAVKSLNLSKETCQQAVETLWHAGFLTQSA